MRRPGLSATPELGWLRSDGCDILLLSEESDVDA